MYIKIDNEIIDDDLNSLLRTIRILDSVLLDLDAEIAECIAHNVDPGSRGLLIWAEHIVGIGFVVLQKYISSTFYPKKIEKSIGLRIGPTCDTGEFVAKMIDATANYWKHNDEWPFCSFRAEAGSDMADVILFSTDLLSKKQKNTCYAFRGSAAWGEFTCTNVLAALTRTNHDAELRLSKLIPLLTEWRNQMDKVVEDVENIIDQLSDYYEPNEARQWMFAPQKLLEGASPAELIRAGRIDEVMRLVSQIRDAVHL